MLNVGREEIVEFLSRQTPENTRRWMADFRQCHKSELASSLLST